MKTAAAYLRCSDPRQDKSIDQQRDEIADRAAKDGTAIPPENWFVDEGFTGRSARKRDAYQALLRRAEAQRISLSQRRKPKNPPIDRLYVWAISRLARNTLDCLKLLGALEEAKIEVVSLTEPEIQDTSMQKLIRPILAWLAERYSDELSRNVRRGMRSQAEKGFWVNGRPPFGYERVPVDGTSGSRLAVTDETRPAFEVVQRLFHDYLHADDGDKRLAETLTIEGIDPPSRADLAARKPGIWQSKHIRQILTNPIYQGHIIYKGQIAYRDGHEAAVDDETFEQVQAKRRVRAGERKAGNGNGESHIRMGERGLLTPWLRCGHCGGRVHVVAGGRKDKRTYLYYCARRSDNAAACDGISVRTERLDRLVLDTIEEQVLTTENLDLLAADALQRLEEESKDTMAQERERLESKVTELDARIQHTAKLVLDGVLDGDDARLMNRPLLARRDRVHLSLAALPGRAELPSPEDIDPERFRAAVLRAWESRPVEERREALEALLDQVTLSEGGIHITYRAKAPEWGYHGHAPYGPPYAPMSHRVPSSSVKTGSPASTQGLSSCRLRSSSRGSRLAVALLNSGSSRMLFAVSAMQSGENVRPLGQKTSL